MKIIDHAGDCPLCGDNLNILKTNQYKRFVRCNNINCDFSYALPKRGSIIRSGYCCSKSGIPILIIERNGRTLGPAYFWTDKPCFTCNKYEHTIDICKETRELIDEFTENGEYGFTKEKIPS